MPQGHYDLYNYIYNEINRESRNILVRRDRFIVAQKKLIDMATLRNQFRSFV